MPIIKKVKDQHLHQEVHDLTARLLDIREPFYFELMQLIDKLDTTGFAVLSIDIQLDQDVVEMGSRMIAQSTAVEQFNLTVQDRESGTILTIA